MPRVSFQHRKTEVNLVPIIILSNVLDFESRNHPYADPEEASYMKDILIDHEIEFSERDNHYRKASEYISALSNIEEKISKGQQSFDPIKELIAINLTKNASMDSTKLYTVLKKLANNLVNQNLNESDIDLLRTITRTLKETTARDD